MMTLILLHPFMPIFNALLGLVSVWGPTSSILLFLESKQYLRFYYWAILLCGYRSMWACFYHFFLQKQRKMSKIRQKSPPHRHRNRIQWQKVAASSKSINTSHKIFALELWNQRVVWFWVDFTICWWYFGWVDKYCIRRQDPNNYSDTETRCLV